MSVEKQVLEKCDYVFCGSKAIIDYLSETGLSTAIKYQYPLAIGIEVDYTDSEKEYDFVYFAADISKACDWAVEAFALLLKKHSGLTLNISGGYSTEYKQRIDSLIKEYRIENSVVFSGPQSSHELVLRQIKKSRFAILPLKVDMISSTVREAMAMGLPVVTTITPATPELNKDRESVLLAEKEDFDGMAEKMLMLVTDSNYSKMIRDNAYLTVNERYSNARFMSQWKQAYYKIKKERSN